MSSSLISGTDTMATAIWNARSRNKLKQAAMDKYGGKCACCGVTDLVFLTINHKNNDGSSERKLLKGSMKGNDTTKLFYRLLRDGPIRDDLNVLCWNCNNAMYIKGTCPHKSSIQV